MVEDEVTAEQQQRVIENLVRLRRCGERFLNAAEMTASGLDPVHGSTYSAEAVTMAIIEVSRLTLEALVPLKDAVLLWLARNSEGKTSIGSGDLVFYGDRGKKEKVKDMPAALVALFLASEQAKEVGADAEPLISILGGDEDALSAVVVALEDFAKSVISKGGIKAGAAKKLLGDQFEEHWDVTWGDRLAKGEPAKKLGIGNRRFIEHHKRGG